MKHPFLKAATFGAALCLPTIAGAQEVNLKSSDGAVNLSGDLIEYQDNVYVIRSQFGPLRVNADLVDCFGEACPNVEVFDNEVTFAGSDTIAIGLLPVVLSGYAGYLNADQQITETLGNVEMNSQFFADQGFGDLINSFRVRSSVSSDAFANLMGKSAEIGVSSRRITVEEARTLNEFGSGSMVSVNNEHILASDSIIVLTHPDNPIKTLTMEQLTGIYNGSISNWSEVGGNDAPIKAVQLKRGAGTRSVFDARITADAPGKPVNVIESDSSLSVSRLVSSDVDAIGYASFAFKRGAHAVTLVNECGLAMTPDAFSAKTGEYVLQRPLYFYTRGDTFNEEAMKFMEWAKSSEADSAVAKSGFIDLGVTVKKQGLDSVRAMNLQNASLDDYERGFANDMTGAMTDFDRLSSTFRFRAGSDRLTPQARVGVERLIEYLERQPASEITFVGFTDDQGPFDSNLSVSEKRAEQMLFEIRNAAGGRLDHVTMSSKGYGELSPVACNVTENGRAINRRVEVWLKQPQS